MKCNDLKLYEPELLKHEKKLISSVLKKYGGKFIGLWCLKFNNGNWSNFPPFIFYQSNPEIEKGHSNYYGIVVNGFGGFICNGKSAFESPIYGIVDNGLVYVSRYRHDYVVTPNGHSIDGGRDYCKYGVNESDPDKTNGRLVKVDISDGKFTFNEINYKEIDNADKNENVLAQQ